MKKTSILILSLCLLSGFSKPKPKVLIIGDSISIGYFPFVQQELSDKAILVHNPGNAEYTAYGLRNIRAWLGTEKWDVIQFNWGLWDLAYRKPVGNDPMHMDKADGKVTATVEEYAKNLDSLVQILKSTHARLIFVTTTYVPENEPGRFTKDPENYNRAAVQVMKANGVLVNDIYGKSKKIHKKYGLRANNVHYKPEGYKELPKYISRFLEKEL